MKKISLMLITLLLSFSIILTGCNLGGEPDPNPEPEPEPTTVAVTGVTLNLTAKSLIPGGTETLVAAVAPDSATDKTVTWTSADDAVASVSDAGLVTAVAVGSTTITVTTTDGSFTATCAITVVADAILITAIDVTPATAALERTSTTLAPTTTLSAALTPADPTESVSWSSSAEAVATVSGGVVTAVAAGTATITASNPAGTITDTCVVTVTNKAATGLTLDITSKTFKLPASAATLTATVAPADAIDKSVTWSSSDEAVATVAAGVVTPVAVGDTTITATDSAGNTATCAVTVTPTLTVNLDGSFVLAENSPNNYQVTIAATDGSLQPAIGDVLSFRLKGTSDTTLTNLSAFIVDATEAGGYWNVISGYKLIAADITANTEFDYTVIIPITKDAIGTGSASCTLGLYYDLAVGAEATLNLSDPTLVVDVLKEAADPATTPLDNYSELTTKTYLQAYLADHSDAVAVLTAYNTNATDARSNWGLGNYITATDNTDMYNTAADTTIEIACLNLPSLGLGTFTVSVSDLIDAMTNEYLGVNLYNDAVLAKFELQYHTAP